MSYIDLVSLYKERIRMKTPSTPWYNKILVHPELPCSKFLSKFFIDDPIFSLNWRLK